MDDDPVVRDIAAAPSPGGSITGNAPDPGLRDPTETRPLYSWARPFPRVPGIRHPFSPVPPFTVPYDNHDIQLSSFFSSQFSLLHYPLHPSPSFSILFAYLCYIPRNI